MSRAFSLVLAVSMTAACATEGDYPSLAPRPVELLPFEEPIKVDPPVAADPALRGQAAELLGRARAGDGAFEAAFARALPAVRGAGASGSDTWVQAQEAISRVEAARIETNRALAELDQVVAEQADEPTSGGDHQALLEAQRAAAAIVADHQRRIEALRSSVSPG